MATSLGPCRPRMLHLGLSMHRLLNMRPLNPHHLPTIASELHHSCVLTFQSFKMYGRFESMSQGIPHCLFNISLSTTGRSGNFGLAITSPSHAPLLFTLFQMSIRLGWACVILGCCTCAYDLMSWATHHIACRWPVVL